MANIKDRASANPFLTYGYAGPEYFCDRKQETADLLSALRNGRNVRIPGLGTFRMTFKSQGADTVEGYDANEMIYEPRVTFLPEASFREALINGLEYEDGGVLEDGVSYASRADYKKAKEGGEP